MNGGPLWIIYRIAANDIRLTWRERSVILWMFAMPLAFTLFFGLSFRGSQGPGARARLTVEDNDDGFLSEDLIAALRSENIAVVDSLAPGEDPVRTLIVPSGFTHSVLAREPVTLVLSRETDADVQASEAVSVAVFRGLVRVVAGLIEIEAEAVGRGNPNFTVTGDSLRGSLWEFAAGTEGALDGIRIRLDEIQSRDHLVAVASAEAGSRDAIPSGFQASVPGNLVMFVLMAMVFSGTAITAERSGGILRRLGSTPAGKREVVLGKLLGRIVVAGIQICFLLLAGKFLFRIGLGRSPAALALLMLAFAFCTGSFSILFGSLFRNPDQVAGFAIITSLVLAALGGCWWPIEVVSRPFQIVAFCLPTGWAISGTHMILSFGRGLESVLPHIGILCCFGLIFVIIASRRLKWLM